jgi:hypothetical protein
MSTQQTEDPAMSDDAAPVEMTVTPDRAYARAVWRAEVRQGARTAGMGLGLAVLLILTSLGAIVAEAPWWTVFGMIGLACGVLLLVMVLAWPFQHRQKESDPLMQPIHYVLAPEAVEWTTETGTVRLLWSAIRGVRLLPHGYLISRHDGGPGHLICRTTLTVMQQAQLRAYFGSHLAEKSTTTGA